MTRDTIPRSPQQFDDLVDSDVDLVAVRARRSKLQAEFDALVADYEQATAAVEAAKERAVELMAGGRSLEQARSQSKLNDAELTHGSQTERVEMLGRAIDAIDRELAQTCSAARRRIVGEIRLALRPVIDELVGGIDVVESAYRLMADALAAGQGSFGLPRGLAGEMAESWRFASARPRAALTAVNEVLR